MYNDTFEQWYKNAKNFTTPYTGLSKAFTDIYQRTMQQHMEIISENFSRTSDQFKRLSQVRKPEDLFELQKECLNENSTAAVSNIQKILQTITENVEEMTELCGSCQQQTTSGSKHTKENIK